MRGGSLVTRDVEHDGRRDQRAIDADLTTTDAGDRRELIREHRTTSGRLTHVLVTRVHQQLLDLAHAQGRPGPLDDGCRTRDHRRRTGGAAEGAGRREATGLRGDGST